MSLGELKLSPKTIFLFLGESFSVLLSKFFWGLVCRKIFTNLGRVKAYAGCQTMLCVRLDEDFRIEHKGAFVSVAFYFVFSPCLSSCPQIIRREANALFFCCVFTLSLFCAIWQNFFSLTKCRQT